jgi:hypothetical protein
MEVVDRQDRDTLGPALVALGSVAEEMGDLDEAERAQREALRLHVATDGPESPAALDDLFHGRWSWEALIEE